MEEKMKKKPPKKTNIARRACQQVQLYARLRDTNADGEGKCCSCGGWIPWEKANGGHWQAKGRAYNGASIMEENVHLQCCTCNCYMQGNNAGYTKFMRKKYEQNILDKIESESYKIIDRDVFKEAHERYLKLNKELAKTKTFKVNIPR